MAETSKPSVTHDEVRQQFQALDAEYSWTEPMFVLVTQIIGRLRAR